MAKRTNDEWISDLRAGGPRQEKALADLHRVILSGLPYALSKWLPASDPRFAAFAEEVTQETLLRVMDKLGTFEGRSQFTTWVHTIAVHEALTDLRRAKWQEVSLDALLNRRLEQNEDAEARELPDHNPSVEKTTEKDAMLGLLRKIISEDLTERQRTALVAVAINEVPMDEVARRLATDRNALYKLLHDARLNLKKRLAQEGLSPAEILALFEQG
jgi:RNA polymerase sigma-70 factor, ECF subfamily